MLQQSFLRRISVLVFVDVDRVEASAKLLCRPLQQPPGLGDEPGVVELITRLENGEVFVEELAGGAPCGPVVHLAEPGQRRPIEAALTSPVEQVGHLPGETPEREGGRELGGPARLALSGGVATKQLADA